DRATSACLLWNVLVELSPPKLRTLDLCETLLHSRLRPAVRLPSLPRCRGAHPSVDRPHSPVQSAQSARPPLPGVLPIGLALISIARPVSVLLPIASSRCLSESPAKAPRDGTVLGEL